MRTPKALRLPARCTVLQREETARVEGGGILVGLIEIFVKLFAPGWYEAVTYGTLIVILLVKPSGILGKNTGEKV